MAFGRDTPPEVGTATQFEPGVSGNVNGKPKGTKHLSTWIQEMMNDESFTGDYVEGYQLKKHKGAPVKAIVRVAALKSLGGDTKWADWLAKYGYGTKQEVDVTSGGERLNFNADQADQLVRARAIRESTDT